MVRQGFALTFAIAGLVFASPSSHAANILFVSDNPPAGPDNAFHPPLVGFPDDVFVVMLQNAGHNVVRFNPPNSQNTLLTPAQIAAINTNDLIFIGRSANSGGFQAPQATNWNTRITKPLICTSPYLVRSDGNRLSWFGGGNGVLPDTTPTRVRAPDPADPETDFLFSGVFMTGDTTTELYDEALDRNTSTIQNAPVAGGKALVTATFVPLAGGAAVTANIITEFPAGTAIPAAAGGTLSGYRMFVAAGTREAAVVDQAGKDNLTPTGENIFLRAVALALNNGVAPIDMNAPVGIQTPPASVTVPENGPATFSVSVTGAPPRLVQWQRDIGDGVTFTNVPNASTSFSKSAVVLPKVTPADNGALFQVVASNAFGLVTSAPAQLTVLIDTTAPTLARAVGKWTMTNITISFSEPVNAGRATDLFNYSADNGLTIDSIVIDATGTNVLLHTSAQTPGTVYTVTVNGVTDLAAAENEIAADSTISFNAFVPAPGFLVSELFFGITGNAVSMLLTNVNYPHYPSVSAYVNISSNPPTAFENYGGRLVGWIVPPVSGDYIFYIRGDDGTDLRLSPNADPAGRVTITSAAAANPPFTASPPQTLVAGNAYFMEALWKEGTGGDYVQVAWRPPWTTNIQSISASAMLTYGDPTGASIALNSQPQNANLFENRSATFSVTASGAPNGPFSYLWQKGDGGGGFTNVLGQPTGNSYTTPLLQYPGDDGSLWRVIASVPGASITSTVATVTVADDVAPPVAIGTGSLDGTQIGICFDELVDPGSATDGFNYTVNDGSISIVEIVVRPDGRSVRVRMATPISGSYSVLVSGISDLAGNTINDTTVSATVLGLTGAELGSNLRVGEHWTCDPSAFEVVGGGADFFGAADTGHYTSQAVTGDFDAKVRINELTLTANTGGALIAKAGLMVRQTGDTGSQTLWLMANAPPPGRDLIEAGYRPTLNGATVLWGPNDTNTHMPNLWVRISRSGNTFNGYSSSNGTDWTLFATTNAALPATVRLGPAVTAHNNVAGLASTGRFSNFSVSQPVADLGIAQVVAPSQVAVGGNATYTITVTNQGPNTANLVTVANPIIAGSAHVSSTASQGSCTVAAGVVTCNLGSLASGSSATITLVTTMNSAGMQTNTATVTSATIDPVSGNNTSSSAVLVYPKPVLQNLSFSSGAGTFSMSIATANGVTYRVEYKNELFDPAWTTLTSITGDGTIQTITDPGPLPPTRFYRVVVD